MPPTTTTSPQPQTPTPVTPAGAQTVASLSSASTSIPASVISAPTLPPLPQPAPSPIPPAPAIPSISSIFNTPPTALDQQDEQAQENEAQLEGQAAHQSTFQDNEDNALGVTNKQNTVNDLTTQLNDLKTAASAIPIQVQQAFAGRGTTAAGLQPIQDAQTRQNTIQQLGISAMLNAANNNLSTAQNQVAAAVKAKFDPINAEIAAQKAQIDALTPLMTEEEKTQAAEQQAQLADREEQVKQQQTDMSSALAMATAAVKNNPNNPTAQSAASQVLNLDPSDPAYLSKVMNLVGQFQSDPIATATALATLQSDRANVAYKEAQTQALQESDLSGAVLAQNNIKTMPDGTQYIDASSLSGTDATKVQQAAAEAGVPYISSADAADLENISTAQTNLSAIKEIFDNRNVTNIYQDTMDHATLDEYNAAMISAVKALAGPGSGGARGAELITQMQDNLPKETDPKAIADQKLTTLSQLLQTAQGSILGTLPSSGTTLMTGPDGKQYNVPNNKVAAFTAAGGHK